jgi:lipoprotein-releasing system ATP-binding protein
MLSIKEITKSFTQRGTVLDQLSLDVKQGETIAIMGPSGSGKTTLMNIIGLLDRPDSGDILFNGGHIGSYNDKKAAEYRNKNIGFVFQDHLLMPYLTVLENILLPLIANGNSVTAEKEKYADSLMQKTGISDLKNKYPSQVSGGEAQRVALVRALINTPSIILADEPTGALDSKNAAMLGELLLDINKTYGISVILATHSIDLASKMSKILKLDNGKLTI